MAAAYPFTCSSCDAQWHLMPGHYELMAGRGVSRLVACDDCRDLYAVTVEFTPRRELFPDEPISWWKRLLGEKPEPRYSQPETETSPLVCPRDASHEIRPWTLEDPCPRCGGGPVTVSDQPSMMVD